MRRQIWICLASLALLVAMPALAGKDAKCDDSLKSAQAEKVVKKCPLSAQECLNKMTAKLKNSGWVGIEYDPIYDEASQSASWKILNVIPESPAEAAGIQPGDAIYAMYGIEFSKANEKKLDEARKEWQPGQEVVYSIDRNGEKLEIALILGSWPADQMAKYIGRHMMEEHAQLADEEVAEASP